MQSCIAHPTVVASAVNSCSILYSVTILIIILGLGDSMSISEYWDNIAIGYHLLLEIYVLSDSN